MSGFLTRRSPVWVYAAKRKENSDESDHSACHACTGVRDVGVQQKYSVDRKGDADSRRLRGGRFAGFHRADGAEDEKPACLLRCERQNESRRPGGKRELSRGLAVHPL